MNNRVFTRMRIPALLSAVLLLALLSACTVAQPPALTEDDMVKLANVDRMVMYSNQEPLAGPISMEEAIARAVKYNLQHRLALMERALADNLTELKHYSMLPKLAAEAGYRMRSNEDASSSESVRTGTQSLEPSRSRERRGSTADLEMTWNVLDFGLSYYEAKAHGNKALAAEERRRRVVGDIVRQTRAAYWAAVSAERMRADVAYTLVQANDALSKSQETGRRRLLAPVASLRYQRDLLNMVRQLEQLENELAKAKTQLASLMNLAPGTDFSLVMPSGDLMSPALSFSLTDLEALAMVRRPELREESYLARNAVIETRMSILRMFPNASLFGGVHYDSNKYLVNSNWASAGAQVSWNLFNLFSLPATLRTGESREQVAELRRQALRMTVLSQVHIAWHQRDYAKRTFDRADELCRLQLAIRQQTENAAASNAENMLELVRTRVETLLSMRARDLSYAEMLNAQDAVYQAAGLDSMPNEVADLSVSGLATAIAEQDRHNELGHAEVPKLAAAQMPEPAAAPLAQAAQPVVAADPAKAEAAAAAPVHEAPRASAVRLISGRPWSSLGSLQGNQYD